MSGAEGQARRGRVWRAVAWGLLGVVVLPVLVVGGMAGRLALGPLDVGWVARRVAPALDGGRLALGGARLGWDVHAARSPLVLSVRDAVLRRADGGVVAQAGRAEVAVVVWPLLLGRVRPVRVGVFDGSVALRRVDGTVGLDDGTASRGVAKGGGDKGRMWRAMRAVRGERVTVLLRDQNSGAAVRAVVAQGSVLGLDKRRPRGRLVGQLGVGGQTSRVTLAMSGADGRVVSGGWSAVVPARLGVAGLAGVAVPVAGRFGLRAGADWRLADGWVEVSAGAGTVQGGGGAVPVREGSARVELDGVGKVARLAGARVVLGPGAGPVVTGTGTYGWGSGEAAGAVAIDRVGLDMLGQYWPAGLAQGGRAWVTQNLSQGVASGVQVRMRLDGAGGNWRVVSVSGGLRVDDATVAWLRPVPPLTHAAGTVTLLSSDAIAIAVSDARQTPSDPAVAPLVVSNASMRIDGLAGASQTAAIGLDAAGPVAQMLALLRENRLRLLSAHPMEFGAPSGRIAAHLQVSLPLERAVTVDQIGIRASARTEALHLGGVIGGRDLDQGELTLTASNDGLAVSGTAALAGIGSALSVAMDFRAGPPQQVVVRYGAHGTAGVAALRAAGLPVSALVDGTVRYEASLDEQRDGVGHGRVHLDLSASRVAVGALHYEKAANADSVVDASVVLDHGRLVGVDRLSVIGPGVTLLGHATYAAGKPVALDLDRIEFGRTRATGRVVFATASDPALHVTVDASLVDLRAGVKGGAASGPVPPTPSQAEARAAARARAAAAASRKRGQAWTVALTMARVELGTGHDPTGVRVTAADDGLVVNRAQVDGQLGGGAFRLSLKPAPQGRRLEAHAADAGTLLQALDVTGSVQGGMLDLNGQFDDGAADHPLSGTLSIGRFEVAGAPAVARLLQAATLYGVVEALHGPGLAISRLVAPFRYADQVLSLRSGRAFSASLGVTAKGEIDLVARRADLSGTIVPAYFFNTLLGRLPLVGKLFSPEAGGGLFAATYTLAGPLAEPKVSVNPLAALTPGILRGLFGLTEPAPDGPRAAIN